LEEAEKLESGIGILKLLTRSKKPVTSNQKRETSSEQPAPIEYQKSNSIRYYTLRIYVISVLKQSVIIPGISRQAAPFLNNCLKLIIQSRTYF
jgi:hypothetical protein